MALCKEPLWLHVCSQVGGAGCLGWLADAYTSPARSVLGLRARTYHIWARQPVGHELDMILLSAVVVSATSEITFLRTPSLSRIHTFLSRIHTLYPRIHACSLRAGGHFMGANLSLELSFACAGGEAVIQTVMSSREPQGHGCLDSYRHQPADTSSRSPKCVGRQTATTIPKKNWSQKVCDIASVFVLDKDLDLA